MATLVNETMAATPLSGSYVNNGVSGGGWQSGGYFVLNNNINQYGALEYWGVLPSAFTAKADFQMSTTSGADAAYFYYGFSATPTTEGDAGGYLINRNDFGNTIEIRFNGTTLTSVTYTKDTTFDTLQVDVSGQTFTITYKGSVVLTYTDSTTRTLPGQKYGWGARSGGTANTHSLENVSLTTTSGTVGSFRFYPRVGWASRIPGGLVQGSSDMSTWTTFYTLGSVPDSAWHVERFLFDLTQYNYVRYLSPSTGYGNIAEIEFYAGSYGSGGTKVTSTITFGTVSDTGNPYSNVFDANTTTFFDVSVASGNYVGIDRRTPICSFRFYPRAGQEGRMLNGMFQGSNDYTMGTLGSGTWTTLYTITPTPAAGWNVVDTGWDLSTYRYIRYLSPTGGYGNVSELTYYKGGIYSGSGTLIVPIASDGTLGSYSGTSSDSYLAAIDGNTSTYFDCLTANGAVVDIDQGPFMVAPKPFIISQAVNRASTY